MNMDKDIVGDINALIEKLLPALNEQLPALIVSEGLDPLEDVVSGTDDLGSIDLGICKAKAEASYSIENMKGLSLLVVETLTLGTCEINGDESTDSQTLVTGTMSLSAELTSNLSADVSGSIKASCGGISEKVGISGTVVAKGVSGSGSASFTATVSVNSSCLTVLNITQLSLKYKDIDVNIDDLGIFNSLLQPLVDAINDLFGSYIEDALSPVVQGVLNSTLKDLLPFCIQY